MKKTLFLSVCFLLALAPVRAQKITILHTNDLHSRLIGFAPSGEYTPETVQDDSTIGGMARIAGYFGQVEEELGEKPLILDAGDFLMGTLFHTLETREGFQLRLMKHMGYDVTAIGNHEFDLGPDKLGEIIARADISGQIPAMVLSNIRFDPERGEDNLLEELYKKETLRKHYVMDYKGLQIGFFGLMGDEAAMVAPYAEPAVFTDRTEVAREMTTYLKEQEGVDLVICLSHSGLIRDKKGRWSGEDVELAKDVPGIDVIISGHSHSQLTEPLIIEGTPIVQAGSDGRYVGRLDLEWKNNRVEVLDGKLIPIDDQIPGDLVIQRQIDEYESRVIQTIFSSLNLKAGEAICETAFDLTLNEQGRLEESNLGPFVSDAIQWYTSQTRKSDLTLVAAGLVRDNILAGAGGKQGANDLFRVVPLGSGAWDEVPGYSLAQVYVTARELKSVLEAMLLAPKLSTSNFPYWSGIRFQYNPLRMTLDQIHTIEIGSEETGYQELDLSKKNDQLYSITTNNYILEFIGLISEVTFGLLKVEPKDQYGQPVDDIRTLVLDADPDEPGIQEIKEWEALLSYASHFEDVNGNGIPDIPDRYREAWQAGVKDSSVHPVKLLKNSNGISAVTSVIGLSAVAVAALVILL